LDHRVRCTAASRREHAEHLPFADWRAEYRARRRRPGARAAPGRRHRGQTRCPSAGAQPNPRRRGRRAG
jgi:hypothetical protein